MVGFQHNKQYEINESTYLYVYNYKKQLLQNIDKLLELLNIKYYVSYGNLLELVRGKPIYQDDDLDIIFDINDLNKWYKFCENNNNLIKWNLKFDDRWKDINKQKLNGIQARLIKFDNPLNIDEYNMDIHMDLVASKVGSDYWPNFKVNFNNLQKVNLWNVPTYIPDINDLFTILHTTYGEDFMIPKPNIKYKNGKFFINSDMYNQMHELFTNLIPNYKL